MRHAKSLALFACAAHAFVARPGPASLRARPVSLSAPLTLRRQAEVRDEDVRKETTDVGTDTARQLLGMKDAASDEDIPLWKIRLQLTKPVTWVPLVWGVACGAAASGNFHWWNPLTIGQVRAQRLASPVCARARNPHGRVVALPARARACAQAGHIPLNVAAEDVAKAIGCMILSGPLLTGYTQTMNDWYDRDIDAINEPYRPIPSGKIKPGEVRVPVNTRAARAVAPLSSPTLSPCRR